MRGDFSHPSSYREDKLQFLLYATPLGLGLDIAGFVLVILYGHSLFLRSGVGPPKGNPGKDGDMYVAFGSGNSEQIERSGRSRRFKAYVGAGLVILGFVLQIVGFLASIHG